MSLNVFEHVCKFRLLVLRSSRWRLQIDRARVVASVLQSLADLHVVKAPPICSLIALPLNQLKPGCNRMQLCVDYATGVVGRHRDVVFLRHWRYLEAPAWAEASTHGAVLSIS